MSRWGEQLDLLIRSRTPILWIHQQEEERLIRLLGNACQRLGHSGRCVAVYERHDVRFMPTYRVCYLICLKRTAPFRFNIDNFSTAATSNLGEQMTKSTKDGDQHPITWGNH